MGQLYLNEAGKQKTSKENPPVRGAGGSFPGFAEEMEAESPGELGGGEEGLSPDLGREWVSAWPRQDWQSDLWAPCGKLTL